MEVLLHDHFWNARAADSCLGWGLPPVAPARPLPERAEQKAKYVGLEYSPFRGMKMGKLTGPVTPRGKARSSQNAAKHWVESKRILPGEEHEAAILRNAFMKDFNPEGSIEHEIIDDIVLNRLIKRRIDIAFTRKSSNQLIDTIINEVDHNEHVAAQYWLRMAGLGNEYRTDGEQAERLQPDLCISILKQLQCRIRESGVQPREDLAVICAAYGLQPTPFAAKAMYQLLSVYLRKTEKDKTAEMNEG
jgi:hypothetical protein